jgi:hypothetical protein
MRAHAPRRSARHALLMGLGPLAMLAVPSPAAAATAPPDPLAAQARLGGAWAMLGQVTRAVGIPGERRGETVSRTWTFTPLCPVGQCPTVALQRNRSAGTDSLVLTRRSPGYYMGTGSFYAPVRCHRVSYRKGQLVPFTITVRITAAVAAGAAVDATRVTATYRNRKRIGLTRCVSPPSYDSASYVGGPAPTSAIRRLARTRSSTASRRRRSGPEAASTT